MVTFKNGESFSTIRILGGTETYQGQQRKTLELDFESDAITLDKAKEIFKNADMLSEITVETGGESSVQLNFSLPIELILTTKRKRLNMDSDDELIVIRVAQKSALEITQEQQAADINDTQLALIELAMQMGGTN